MPAGDDDRDFGATRHLAFIMDIYMPSPTILGKKYRFREILLLFMAGPDMCILPPTVLECLKS